MASRVGSSGKRTESVSFRPSADTRELVEDAAKTSGQSLSAEVDQRLREAYWDGERKQEALEVIFGGKRNLALGFLVSRIATGLENQRQARWYEDSTSLEQLSFALLLVLNQLGRERLPNDVLAVVGTDIEPETRALVRAALSPDVLKDGSWWPLGQGETQADRLEVRRSMHSQIHERIIALVREALVESETRSQIPTKS